MVYALCAEEQHLVADAMVQPFALFVKEEVVLLQLDMVIIFLVQLVIRLANARFVKVLGNAYVLNLIFQDTYQAQIRFMEQMEELSLQIALEAVEVLPLNLPHLHAHGRHHPQVDLVADVVEQVLIQLLEQTEA